MKKPTLLLQFRTDRSEIHEQTCIMKKGGYLPDELKIINVLKNGNTLPKPEALDNYQAVITGASGQYNTTDWPPDIRRKVEKFLPLLREIIKRDKPLLAICFGHQIIANLLEGKVENDEDQAETGTISVSLTKEGRKSDLFENIPDNFHVVLGHKDSVTKLPKQAMLLAKSKTCRVEAYKIKNNIYSVQFHPELDLDGLIWRLKLYPEYLKGKTFKQVRSEYNEIPYASKIIENFKKITFKNGFK